MSPGDTSGGHAGAIRDKALALGFARVGFCDTMPTPEMSLFRSWLEAGMHGTMEWMRRGAARRLDPQRILEGARSFVVVAVPYASPFDGREDPPPVQGLRGVVARYAHGKDYHDTVGERVRVLERFIEHRAPGHRAMAYVDTGPILERMWAARAGIGWVGKNSLVLNKDMGSYFFLGVVLTTLRLPPDEPSLDQCGSCTLCIEACPTGAIVEPRVVDSRRCLSYHTIELRGPLPREHRVPLGERVFGCDDCQDACPWNRQHDHGSGGSAGPHPEPRADDGILDLRQVLALSHEEYLDRFRGSAIKRATYNGLRRNAAIALGNRLASAVGAGAGDRSEAISLLRRVADDEREPPDLREQASWSIARATG